MDSLHEFRLSLGDRSVVVKGRVAHCSISDVDQEVVTYRSGIEFIELSDRVFAVIADFIDAIKTGRRAGCNERYCGIVLTSPVSTRSTSARYRRDTRLSWPRGVDRGHAKHQIVDERVRQRRSP